LWNSINGYAATAGDNVLTIVWAGDGPHVLEVRNRPDKDLRSTAYQLRFKSLVTASMDRQVDLQTTQYVYDSIS